MRHPRLLVLALAIMLGGGACGAATPSSGAVASGVAPTTPPSATDDPAAIGGPGATNEPAATEAPAATDEPVPTDAPTATESAANGPSAAGACSGSDDNRLFFERFADAVDWPVLCGVLPKGWFVDEGKYRLASGGWLRIGYKGPGGASLWLYQGAACAVDGGCSTSGSDLGGVALGPLDGTLYETSDGFAAVAAPGENPSWYLTTTGLDRATTVELAGALAVVGG